jgi:hypothetical protein
MKTKNDLIIIFFQLHQNVSLYFEQYLSIEEDDKITGENVSQ